jgi:hypothetical protein
MLSLAEGKLAALEPERRRARERFARAQEQALRAGAGNRCWVHAGFGSDAAHGGRERQVAGGRTRLGFLGAGVDWSGG